MFKILILLRNLDYFVKKINYISLLLQAINNRLLYVILILCTFGSFFTAFGDKFAIKSSL